MKRRFSLAIMALCAMISFSSLHAADPDPYRNTVEKDDYQLFNPSGNFSVQARLALGESAEARNADGKGFSYTAEKPGVYSFLVDVTGGTVSVYWGPTLEATIPVTTVSDKAISFEGEDLVNAENQNEASRRGIYSTKNLFSNPGFEKVTLYDDYTSHSDMRGIPENWSVLPAYEVATSCRAIEVSNNTGYAEMRSIVEGDWVFMLHNVTTPLWQKLSGIKASTWYKVHYRQLSHKDTSPATPYISYIAADSAILAADNENVIASHSYISAPQDFGNYVEASYAFKTPATLPNELYFAVAKSASGCINHFDRMTLIELSESEVNLNGFVSQADQMTWEEGLQEPQGGSEEIFEDVTADYFSNPSFEDATMTAAERSLGPDRGNSGVWVPAGWNVDYSLKTQSADEWDQGLVTSGPSAYNHDPAVPDYSDTGFTADDGENFYYFRTRWKANQDFEIYQTLKDLPAGRYLLTAAAAADVANPATFSVSGVANRSITIADPEMKTYSIDLNLLEAGDMKVSVYVERIADSQARLAIDNFRLIYRGVPDEDGAIEDFIAIVENAEAEFAALNLEELPSGINHDYIKAQELTRIAESEWTVEAWEAAANLFTATLEDAYLCVPLYEKIYNLFENVNLEIEKTGLSGAAAYDDAANIAIQYIFPDNPNLYYSADLEQAVEDLLAARRAYYSTGFNDATVTAEKNVTYAIDYNPYFTVYGGDISSTSDRVKGNWETNNNPASYDQYKLHTVNGMNCWNNWHGNFVSMDLYQELTGLPEGMYRISAYTTTNGDPNDQHAYVTTMAGTAVSPYATYKYTESSDFDTKAEWEQLLTEKVYLPEGGTLRIGFASTSGGGTSGWFCATGFELYYSKATATAAYEALQIKIADAEALLDTAAVKIMAVETAALNKAITNAKSATAEQASAAFAPLNTAMENANTSILNYNNIYVLLAQAKAKVNESGYPQSGKDQLSAVILSVEEILTANDTEASALPPLTKVLEKALIVYEASGVEIPSDVSPTKPHDLTYLIVNPTVEAESNTADVDGWKIARTDGDKNTTIGQHYADSLNRYFDSWNASAGKLKFTVTQEIQGVPNGTYRLVAMTRSSGEGAYLYAYGSKPYAEEIENFGSEGGPIYDAAAEGSDIKEANKGLGWGWQQTILEDINVDDYTITIGISNDPSVTRGKDFTGNWYSADEFQLFYIDTEFFTGVTDVNAEENKGLIVYTDNGYIIVEGEEDFKVTTLSGATVPSNAQLAPGFYIVTASGKSAKVVVK